MIKFVVALGFFAVFGFVAVCLIMLLVNYFNQKKNKDKETNEN